MMGSNEPIDYEVECGKLLVEVDRLSELSEKLSDQVHELVAIVDRARRLKENTPYTPGSTQSMALHKMLDQILGGKQ